MACRGLHTWSAWGLHRKAKTQTTLSRKLLLPLLTMRSRSRRENSRAPTTLPLAISTGVTLRAEYTIPCSTLTLAISHHPALTGLQENLSPFADEPPEDREGKSSSWAHSWGLFPRWLLTYAAGLGATPCSIRLAEPPWRAHEHQRGLAGEGDG